MKEYDDFYEEFLIPVITDTYKHLQRGGKFILNIPIDMYNDTVKKILGPSNKKLILKKGQRTGSGKDYKEYIYIWNK